MNAKLIIFGAIVAVALGIVFLSLQPPVNDAGQKFVFDPNSGDEFNPVDISNPAGASADLSTDLPDFTKATTSADCDKQSGAFREECYSNLAKIKNDASYCNSISKENYELADNCFYNLAVTEKQTGLCFQMAYGAADCLTEIALATNDPAACEQASFEKDMCLKALKENDYALCRNLGWNRLNCVEAIDNKDASFCNSIYNSADSCFEQLGIQAKNPGYCKKIFGNSDSCYYEIALATNNANLCELVKETRDQCIAWVAFNTNDKALCERAGTERQSCLDDVA
ncbi:MAG: hypothetical protein AABW85_04740 [archaeon]